MQCRREDEIWLGEVTDGDAGWADHLASCASCRAAADQVSRQRRLLNTPVPEASATVLRRFDALRQAVPEQTLTCRESLERLEAYREHELSAVDTFLMDDHLLWCESCAAELASAEAVESVLRELPRLTPPEAIAERFAAARRPWWQRLWQAPAPTWHPGRLLQVGGAVALAALAFGLMLHRPSTQSPVANNGVKPTNDRPVIMQQGHRDHIEDIGTEAKSTGTPAPDDQAPVDVATVPANAVNRTPEVTMRPSVPEINTPETASAVAVAVPLDSTPTPRSKMRGVLDALTKAMTPSKTIANRATVAETPVQPDTLRAPVTEADPAPRKLVAEKRDTADYSSTAREALLRIHAEATLASNDDDWAVPPETVRVAFAASQPQQVAAVYAPPADDTDEVNRRLTHELKRGMDGPLPAVTMRSSERERGDGVLFRIH